MKLLIHGDDTASSRSLLYDKLHKYGSSEKITFDGNKINITDIVTAADSRSLYSESKIIIIENFFSRTLTAEKKLILEYISTGVSQHPVIFWEDKEIDKAELSKYFKREEIISCQPPMLLFKFLDAFGTASTQTVMALYKNLLKEREALFILTMLFRQIRILIIAKDSGMAGLGELSPWQAQKFYDQSRHFNLTELITKYRALLLLEYNFKSGKSPYTFEELLDIYLVNI